MTCLSAGWIKGHLAFGWVLHGLEDHSWGQWLPSQNFPGLLFHNVTWFGRPPPFWSFVLEMELCT